MARGYSGAFGRRVNAWYVWVPLCLLFIAPFLPWRRTRARADGRRGRAWSLLHLDLLVLLGLSISLAFFNHGMIGISTPITYPFMLYLLVRMLLLGFGRGRPREPLRLFVPVAWLAIATDLPGRVPHRPERRQLQRDRRRVRRGDRSRQAAARQAAVRKLAEGQRQRRHLRPGRLLRLRPVPGDLRLERRLGRPPRRPRRRDRVRPAHAVRAVLAGSPRPWPHARRGAGLRLGRVPVHAVDAVLQHQRLAGGAAARRRAACDHLGAGARRGRGARRPDEVRAIRSGAAAPAGGRTAAAPPLRRCLRGRVCGDHRGRDAAGTARRQPARVLA